MVSQIFSKEASVATQNENILFTMKFPKVSWSNETKMRKDMYNNELTILTYNNMHKICLKYNYIHNLSGTNTV